MSSSLSLRLKTRQEVLEEFDQEGQTISGWALAHDFSVSNVYAVLAGKTHGRRGESHRIAVALGLKRGKTTPVQMGDANMG